MSSQDSYIINAPSQFGLTTLSHYLVLKAWEKDELWIYIDNAVCKPHQIQNAVKNEVKSLELEISDVKCIVFDSFNEKDKVSLSKLKKLLENNKGIKIIILNTVDESLYIREDQEEEEDDSELDIEVDLIHLHLIALPRTLIRTLVKQYNKEKNITEDEKLLSKITKDLECLNMHRTPYNIITLLKVSEKYFDNSPVNRTRVIEMILFVLFDLGEFPTYKTKPDLKDCEYVLGRYCELILRNQNHEFEKESFIKELKGFCEEKLIDLEVEVVFETLRNNNIIIPISNKYRFKSSFWIYYFGAKRMHSDKNFRDYIFNSKKYSAYPEIIEFYTGIDRNRDEVLKILLNDLKETKENVEEKLGIKGEINPLGYTKWKPSENTYQKIQKEISGNVLSSKLPDEVKDQHLDRRYNQIKPYDQSIQKLFEEYSLYNLIQQIRASSTALRNSDYANPELKKKLIEEIYQSWKELSKVLFAFSPIMAQEGKMEFQGTSFKLHGDFGKTFEERFMRILQVLPTNIVGYFQDELYSPKMAPLLYDSFKKEKNELIKHHQALLLVFKRPKEWKQQIENYITTLNKNSFYLWDIVNALRARYRYDFAENEELSHMKMLIKMGMAKHEFGGERSNYVSKISNINNSVIPTRELYNEETKEETSADN